ncbi:MAG: DUF6164 family protein [Candidatus Thiodiazotropha sp.]
MSFKIFSLRDVPETEANGIRQLLAESNIKFYETPTTFITDGSIWVYEESDIEKAKELIDAFEAKWQRQNVRESIHTSANKMPRRDIILNFAVWLTVAIVLMLVFRFFSGD